MLSLAINPVRCSSWSDRLTSLNFKKNISKHSRLNSCVCQSFFNVFGRTMLHGGKPLSHCKHEDRLTLLGWELILNGNEVEALHGCFVICHQAY